MENTEPNLAEAPGPEPVTQPSSKPKRRYYLDRSKALALRSQQESESESQLSVEKELGEENRALEELHLAKSALVTVEAHQKQEKFELTAKHSRQLTKQAQERTALQTKHADQVTQQSQERMDMRAEHAKQITQANLKILELRSRYLEAQRRGGVERKLATREQKEMAAFEKESKFTRTTAVRTANVRIQAVKAEMRKLKILKEDWSHAGPISEPVAKRLPKFESIFMDMYTDNCLENETPDEFVARQEPWLMKQLVAAQSLQAQAEAGPHAMEKQKFLGPILQPKEGAKINQKAREKRLYIEGLGMDAPPKRIIH